MNDVVRVGVGQCACDLDREVHRALTWYAIARVGGEWTRLHVLLHEIERVALRNSIIGGDDNRMREGGGEVQGFAIHAHKLRRNNLDDDRAMENGVAPAIHRAERPPRQLFVYVITVEQPYPGMASLCCHVVSLTTSVGRCGGLMNYATGLV